MRWQIRQTQMQQRIALDLDGNGTPDAHVSPEQLRVALGGQHHGNAVTGARPWALPGVDARFAAPATRQPALPHPAYFSEKEIADQIRGHYGETHLSLEQNAAKVFSVATVAMGAAMSGKGVGALMEILGGNTSNHRNLAVAIKRLAGALSKTPPDIAEVTKLAKSAQWKMVPLVARNKKERTQATRYLKWAHGLSEKGSYTGQGPFGAAVNANAPGATQIAPGQFTAHGASQTGQKALEAARSQLGVREASGRNDGVPSQRYMNGRKEPWCANFVAWAFRQTGQELPGNQRSLASVQYMEDSMKKAGKFHTGVPAPGDIIFFKNRGRSDRGTGRHVGIVEKVENGFVYTIEGNTSNAVRRRKYSLSEARISGYGRA